MTILADNKSNDTAPVYAQLTLGKTRLLFPQPEVLSLEALPEIGMTGVDGRVGVVKLNDTILPVYNFDEQLHLNGDAQDAYRVCVCLGNGKTEFALLCDKVEAVEGAALQVVDLPACMRSVHTPVQSLVLQGAKILCVTSVERFSGVIHVSPQGEVQP